MRVEAISIGPSDAIATVGSVNAVAGKGLVGDRHFYLDGAKPGRALTLIEAEVLEDVRLTGAQSRRQLVVRGVRLNDLVGKRFRVGNVECLGVELLRAMQAPAGDDAARHRQAAGTPWRVECRYSLRRSDLGRGSDLLQ